MGILTQPLTSIKVKTTLISYLVVIKLSFCLGLFVKKAIHLSGNVERFDFYSSMDSRLEILRQVCSLKLHLSKCLQEKKKLCF